MNYERHRTAALVTPSRDHLSLEFGFLHLGPHYTSLSSLRRHQRAFCCLYSCIIRQASVPHTVSVHFHSLLRRQVPAVVWPSLTTTIREFGGIDG